MNEFPQEVWQFSLELENYTIENMRVKLQDLANSAQMVDDGNKEIALEVKEKLKELDGLTYSFDSRQKMEAIKEHVEMLLCVN